MSLTPAVHRSITSINRADWERLFGSQAEGYDYFRTLETSRLPGFEFAYACLSEGATVRLIAPLFWSDLDVTIGTEGFAGKAVARVRRHVPRFLIFRTLFVGSPFGEHGAIGMAQEDSSRDELLRELARVTESVARENGLRFILFKDFLEEDRPRLAVLERLGFTRAESFPNVVVPLPFADMDAYLASLSYGTRKDLRRKVRKTLSAAKMTVEVVDDIEALLPEIYELYLKTYEAGTVHFEKLTPEYFVQVGRLQRGAAKFFLFRADGRLVCFNLCFLHDGVLVDKFIGMDYSVARELNLYYYTWSHNIEWCLRSGVKAYQVGQTDYEAKLQLGGKRVPLYFWARHRNAFMNTALKLVAPLLTPDF